ncbi:MAG TPA: hypothetical protein VF077_12955 [Nitrospiraceae bacterium]
MSFETWRQEFYPVPASEVSADDALAHSIRKWEGLQAEALVKHGLWFTPPHIVTGNDGVMPIGGENCALCLHHDACNGCPLHLSLGKACFEGGDTPWVAFVRGNAAPMLAALKRAQEQEKGTK